jgi:hypothetical protein
MTLRQGFVVTVGFLVAAGCSAEEDTAMTTASQRLTLNDRIALCSSDPRVFIGIVSLDTCVGADLFLRETFNGNGRSCATCHPVTRNFTIDPAFIAQLPSSDPLFIAETDPALAQLEIPRVMRQFGLILENVDGFAPDPTTHFVLRSVPHTLSLATSIQNPPGATSPPVNRTGWSGDGAPDDGSLRSFQTGAIRQHYTRSLLRIEGTDFRLADSGELDKIAHFMTRLGRVAGNELALATVVMADAGADAGRTRFLSVGCHACHGNAGANASFGNGGNRNFNTGVEPARNSQLAGFPRDGGFGTGAQAGGSFGDGTFNTTPLIEAADTGPFFHTATTVSGASAHNTAVATTIEEAIAFYDTPAFNSSPSGQIGPINLTAQEIDNIGRFLRGVNASFNIALASRRIEAVGDLLNEFNQDPQGLNAALMELAILDAQDAVRVLSEVPNLNPAAQNDLNDFIVRARNFVSDSFGAPSGAAEQTEIFLDPDDRLNNLRSRLSDAQSAIGRGLTYQIGDGVLMF